MGKKCIIPGCKSGYSSNKERVSLFRLPQNDESRAKWVSVIPATKLNVTSAHSICEKHFLTSDIKRHFVHRDKNGKIIANVAYQYPRLSKTAIPSIFPSTSKHCIGESVTINQSFESAGLTICESNNEDTVSSSTVSQPGIKHIDCEDINSHRLPKPLQDMNLDIDLDPKSGCFFKKPCVSSTESNTLRALEKNSGVKEMNPKLQDCNVCQTEDRTQQSSTFEHMFINLYESANAVSVPVGWIRYTSNTGNKKWVAFSNFEIRTGSNGSQPLPRKSVLVSEGGDVHASANGKTISIKNICRTLEFINNVDKLSRLLLTLASLKVCAGVQLLDDSLSQHRILYQDTFGSWRDKNCSIISIGGTCSVCRKIKRSMTQRRRRLMINNSHKRRNDPIDKNIEEKCQIIDLRKIIRSKNAVIRRARERVKKCKNELSKMQERVRNLNERSIIEKCNELNLPPAQQLCIKEIISSATKKSPLGNRYTEDWIMLCLLMHIRSPDLYRFLSKNEILPLPAPRTIRRYFSVINTRFDFDENFFRDISESSASKISNEKERDSSSG